MQAVIAYVEKLRQEPEAKRRRFLWWSTSLITLIIALGWFATWRAGTPVELPAPVAEQASVAPDWRQGLADAKLKIITGWQTIIPKN